MNYYSFSHNLGHVSGYVHNILKSSCAKLLAAKFSKPSQKKIFEEFGKNLKGSDKVAFVEPIYTNKVLNFMSPDSSNRSEISNTGMISTLYAISAASLENLKCAICKSDYRVEKHHIRKLENLKPKLRKIYELMAKRRRKQIPSKCNMENHSSNSNISKSSS